MLAGMSSGFDPDPYASPRSPVEREDATGAMKSGGLLMVRSETELPPGCPFTGLPIEASWPVEWHVISWNSPWSYLPFFAMVAANALLGNRFGWMGYAAIAAAFMVVGSVTSGKLQARGRIAYAIYPPLKRSMRRKRLLSLGIILLALATAWLISLEPALNGLATTLTALLCVVLSLVPIATIPRLRVTAYRGGWFYLKGCSPELLSALPEAGISPR